MNFEFSLQLVGYWVYSFLYHQLKDNIAAICSILLLEGMVASYVISALDSASGDLGLSPRGSWNHFVVFLGKTVLLSTQVYTWVLVNITLE